MCSSQLSPVGRRIWCGRPKPVLLAGKSGNEAERLTATSVLLRTTARRIGVGHRPIGGQRANLSIFPVRRFGIGRGVVCRGRQREQRHPAGDRRLDVNRFAAQHGASRGDQAQFAGLVEPADRDVPRRELISLWARIIRHPSAGCAEARIMLEGIKSDGRVSTDDDHRQGDQCLRHRGHQSGERFQITSEQATCVAKAVITSLTQAGLAIGSTESATAPS